MDDDARRAVSNDDARALRSMLKRIDINAQGDHQGFTLLILAAMSPEKHTCVRALLEGKAELDTKSLNNGWTALMYAAVHDCVATARLLIEAGANVGCQDPNGETAFTLAFYYGNLLDIPRLLLKKGCNPDHLRSKGNSTLHMVASKIAQSWYRERTDLLDRDVMFAKFLLESGANLHLKNDAGQSPLSLARKHSHDRLVELFSSGQKEQTREEKKESRGTDLTVEEAEFLAGGGGGGGCEKQESLPSKKPVLSWKVEDVSRWLHSLQLSNYCDTFREQSVDGTLLLHLTETDMAEELKMKPLHRKKLVLHLRTLHSAEQPPPPAYHI